MLSKIFLVIMALLGLLVCAQVDLAQAGGGAAAQQPLSNAERYVCPMHPEVISAKPGSCPECQMALRRVKDGIISSSGLPGSSDDPAPVNDDGQETAASSLRIPDSQVLDQEGRKLKFYTDLVKGKTVAINFIFTTCTTICPPLAATFARVQRELGERAGRDVHLISISVDPVTDTPERLKAWGTKFRAGKGWTFLTGSKPDIDGLLRVLGSSIADKTEHSPTVIVINDDKGSVIRTYGLAKPSQLIKIIDDAVAGTDNVPSGNSLKP